MIAAERSRLDIGNLADQAALFQHRLDAVRAGHSNPGFDCYPYDSLVSLHTLAGLLSGPRKFRVELIGDKPVLDVGCGDGHIAFFLESLGCQVIAIDNPQPNFNRMQGVRALRAALHSKIEIVEQDIDYNFSLPDTQCSVALLLGVLYHLKNPFSVLETLLARAQYCILSTRVTRLTSRNGDDLSRFPVAYLVNETETNNDSTNYWIFTSVGLKRLIERSGWRIVDYATFGNTADSDPISREGDERAFCFADRISKPITNGQLAGRWHEQESFQTRRCTERKLSAVFSHIAI